MSQQINLYNPIFVPPREWVSATALARGAGACAVLILLGAAGTHWLANAREARLHAAMTAQTLAQGEFERVKLAQQSVGISPVLSAQLQQKTESLALRERVLAQAQVNLDAPDARFSPYLSGFARQGLQGLWLTRIGIDANGERLSLSGQAMRQELVPEYVRRLNKEAVFAGKTFAGIEVAQLTPVVSDRVPPGVVVSSATGLAGGSAPVRAPDTVLTFRLIATPEGSAR